MLRAFVTLSLFIFHAPAMGQIKAKDEAPYKAPSKMSAHDIAINEAITRGVDFLISHQNNDGSWGGPTRTKGLNIYAPVPDAHQAFHTASTSLALHGLLESRDSRLAAKQAAQKAEAWLLKKLPAVRNIDRRATYNVWAHAYSLRALASLYRSTQDSAKKALYKQLATQQIQKLKRYESVDQGWGYLDMDDLLSNKPSGITFSFLTATVLLAMDDAAQTMQIKLPPVLIKRSVRSIQMQRNPDFTYAYSLDHRMSPRNPINRPAGSLARSQACNLALRKFSDQAVTDAIIETWLQRLFDRQGWLDNGRKRPRPHEAPAAVSGYFYYYGHYYAAESISVLPAEKRSALKRKLATLIISKQEKNGSWWDYPLYNYHYAYGTGYALATLAWCR